MTAAKSGWKQAMKQGLWLLLGIGLNACAGAFGSGGETWKEEAMLHDGRTVMVEHHTERGGRHELGQRSAITEHSISFIHPDTGKTLSWLSAYAPELGRTDLNPWALHVSGGVAYVVTEPNLCLSYNKWGRPNPPYVIFKFTDNAWQRISIAQLPAELTTFNLMRSYGNEVELAKAIKPLGYVSAEAIKQGNAEDYREHPEFNKILREPVAMNEQGCIEMVSNGKGTWLATAKFQKKASLDACETACRREEFDEAHCPCKDIFVKK